MLTFCEMNEYNVSAVAALERECFGEHCWSEKLFREELPQSNKHYIVCVEEGKVVGYGGYASVIDEAQIMNIAVASDHRRQGIGKQIIDIIVADATARGLLSATLEVRISNAAARTLYEKANFLLAGVRKNYYDGKEDACIYWRVF